MDAVYEELEEAKSEIEYLKEQYRVKSQLAESLKKAHNDQQIKFKEASSQLEKLTQELSEKNYDISSTKQVNEELKSSLKEKESIIKNLSFTHDKLRVDCNQKLHKFEKENKALALALDESNAKSIDQSEKICALEKEIDGVKRLLASINSQNKCSETENKVKACKEVEAREDGFFKLEEENRKFKDDLKWKNEQFGHLKEAHDKLRNQFKTKEKEWEKEKARLFDDISTLQTNLESQIRISQDFEQRFEMCNMALAHAESKRKVLEAQLLESRANFDNVCVEFEEAKSKFETMNTQRDQEIATLRSSLGTKDVLYKEMEYQYKKLEQEKQEMLVSLKELHEARIYEAGNVSSSSKLQKKLKSLEQVHKGCLANLQAKEIEWQSRMEKLISEVKYLKSESESKDLYTNELRIELEAKSLEQVHKGCLANLQAKEIEWQSRMEKLISEVKYLKSESESKDLYTNKLRIELEAKSLEQVHKGCLANLQAKEIEWQSRTEKLISEVKYLKSESESKELYTNELKIELEACDDVILKLELLNTESSLMLLILKSELSEAHRFALKNNGIEENTSVLEREVKRLEEKLDESLTSQLRSEEQVVLIKSDMEKVCDELNGKFCEANEIELELTFWKSVAEQLEVNGKQNVQMRRELEASLLAQVEVEVNLKQEKESLGLLLEEKEKKINQLQKQLVEEIDKENERETETTLHQIVEEKDQRIYDLQRLVASLEQEFESSSSSFSCRLSEMGEEMNILRESWEKIKENEFLKEIEIQEKDIIIIELENDLGNSERKSRETQVELERKQLECELNKSFSEEIIKKLKDEKTTILEDSMKLSLDNEKLVNAMSLISERMEILSMEDMKLMEDLGKMVLHNVEIDDSDDDDEEHDPLKENVNNAFSSPSFMKKVETIHDERSPFRALNN